MPRKDGQPTAAERANAERVAGNLAYIAAADATELARLAADPTIDGLEADQVRSEIARREAVA